jgi:hypothetical protein
MKPKRFASLNHLTVPVAIIFPVLVAERAAVAQRERAVDRHDEPLFGTRTGRVANVYAKSARNPRSGLRDQHFGWNLQSLIQPTDHGET